MIGHARTSDQPLGRSRRRKPQSRWSPFSEPVITKPLPPKAPDRAPPQERVVSFADRYREQAVPKLSRLAKVQGFLVGCRVREFGEAHAILLAEASRLGMPWLPEQDRQWLEDWLLTRLFEEIDAADQRMDEAARIAGAVWQPRHYMANVAAIEAALAASEAGAGRHD